MLRNLKNLTSAAKESKAVVIDIDDALISRETHEFFPLVEAKLRELGDVARDTGKPLCAVTEGSRADLEKVVRVLGAEVDYRKGTTAEFTDLRDGVSVNSINLQVYPTENADGLRFFGVYDNGGVFAFFDGEGNYYEVNLISPESIEKADRFLTLVHGSRILGDAVKRYAIPVNDGYLIKLPVGGGYGRYLDQLEGEFNNVLKVLGIEKDFIINREGDSILRIGPRRRLYNGRTLSKGNGLKSGLSLVTDVLGLDYSVDGAICVAYQIEYKRDLLRLARLGVNVTNNGSSAMLRNIGSTPVVDVKNGAEGVEAVKYILKVSGWQGASLLDARNGMSGMDLGKMPFSEALGYLKKVDEAQQSVGQQRISI